jgi:hypothetical protein
MSDMSIKFFRNNAMYEHIKAGLDKIERDAGYIRELPNLVFNAQPAGIYLPTHAIEAIATCYIINAVSIFDEALELVLNEKFALTRADLNNLKTMIDYAGRVNSTLDTKALQDLRETRNDLAHELGQYRNWPSLDNALQLIRTELGKLGVL